jgi:hypothetical protein
MKLSEEQHTSTAEKLKQTFKARRTQRPHTTSLRGFGMIEGRIRAGDSPEKAVYTVIENLLTELATHAPTQADLLRQRWNGSSMGEISEATHRSEADLFRQEKEAFGLLANLLDHEEQRLQRQRQMRWLRTVPPAPYTRLVGAQPKLKHLLPHFMHEDAPWLIALVGMGGIGKTSLTHALVRELLTTSHFDQVAWVSAQQVLLSLDGTMEIISEKPALTLPTLIAELGQQLLEHRPEEWRLPLFEKEDAIQEYLLKIPTVVVVDNLETVKDMDLLLPFLQSVRGPTKFILTSRVTPTKDGSSFNYAVPPLSYEETVTLIQQEAQTRNLHTLLHLDQATTTLIYNVTGGNPLALRLVVGQVELHGIPAVLEDLRHAKGAGASLYRYLYEWVWEHLSKVNRTVLHALLVLTDGNSTAPAIQKLTQMDRDTIHAALQQLVQQNLVMLQGNLEQRYYTLHNLTRAFLEEMNRSHGNNTDTSPGSE